MKNLKLSIKMTLGFGGLIFIAGIIGSLTVLIMKDVIIQTLRLGEEYIPQVSVANQIERSSLAASDAMQLYALSREERHLNIVKKNLAKIRQSLKTAEQLSQQFPDLITLKNAVTMLNVMLKGYEQLTDDIVRHVAIFRDNQKAIDTLSAILMSLSIEFMDRQTDAMKKQMASEFISAVEAGQLQERFKKITSVQDVIRKGNEIYVGYSEFQAARTDASLQNTLKHFDPMFQTIRDVREITRADENIKKVEEIANTAVTYKEAISGLLKNWAVLQELGHKAEEIGNTFLKETVDLAEKGMNETLSVSHKTGKSLSMASKITIGGLIYGLIASILFAVFMIRSITKPIHKMIRDISGASVEVRNASDQISRVSQSFAEGLSEQAAALEESSSAMEEIASFTRQNADNASEVNLLMKKTCQIIDKAEASMNELTRSMDNIAASGHKTVKIIKLIEGISFQTNILSLNASIEAARSGDAGSGFAVVAAEVKNLAIQVKNAIQEVSQLIEKIIYEIKEGSESVIRNSKAFEDVATDVADVGSLIEKISADSEEQAQKIAHVNKAVADIDKVVQNNAAGSEQTASSAEELRAQSEGLVGFVNNMEILINGKKGSDNNL
jgi:methyl-accepting chemotaxis protein